MELKENFYEENDQHGSELGKNNGIFPNTRSGGNNYG
jgi:hypothetical protein